MKVVSKVTSKYQATIPKAVRERLGIGKGDMVLFDLTHDCVVLSKATPMDLAYLRSVERTLEEWESQADEEAYRDL